MEHASIIHFFLAYEKGEIQASSPKHRRWLTTLSVTDYGVTQKVIRKGTNLELVKTSVLFDKIHEAHMAEGHCVRDKMHI